MVTNAPPSQLAQLIDAFRDIGAATAHECQKRTGALSAALKPLAGSMRVCGPAYTVRLAPGDNLGLHYAVKFALPGDVIVIDAGDFIEAGPFGEILALAARTRGLAGLVTTGSVRDAQQIRALGFPVFCKGVSMKGTAKAVLPQTALTITLDGVTIRPHDIVLGDADGVVVIPQETAADVLRLARARAESEIDAMAQVKAGAVPWDLLGLDATLQRLSAPTSN